MLINNAVVLVYEPLLDLKWEDLERVVSINRHLLQKPEEYAQALKRIPLGRFGQPVDIANAFVFMASDASAYVTGHTLVVDGSWILP